MYKFSYRKLSVFIEKEGGKKQEQNVSLIFEILRFWSRGREAGSFTLYAQILVEKNHQ